MKGWDSNAYKTTFLRKKFPSLIHSAQIRASMYFSLFATLFMSLKPTLSIPLEAGFSPATDMSSLSEDPDPFDAMMFLEPDSQDISLTSPTDDLTNLFSPSSFFADTGTENEDLQLLLSSDDSGAFCPLGKRKRDSGYCGSSEAPSSAAPPTLVLPSILDNFPGQEGNSEGAGVATSELGGDPCLVQVGYPTHLCCRGPPGYRVGLVYEAVENCALGQLSLIISWSFTVTRAKVSKSVVHQDSKFSLPWGDNSWLSFPWLFIPSTKENSETTWLVLGYLTWHKCPASTMNVCCEKYAVSPHLFDLHTCYLSICPPTGAFEPKLQRRKKNPRLTRFFQLP